MCDDPGRTLERAQALVACGVEHGFADYEVRGRAFRGWALARLGKGEEGLSELRASILAQRETGTSEDFSFFLEMLAEVYGLVGQPAEGLTAIDEALQDALRNEAAFWSAATKRREALLTVQNDESQTADAIAFLHEAVAIAREQRARLLELQATLDLARLLKRAGELDDARSVTAAKKYFRGTERTEVPVQTLERVGGLLAAMGITRIANVTGLDKIGIPVVMACRPNSRSVSVFQGKGADLDAARASGVMEAVETYHGESIMNPLKLASFDEMRQRHAVVDGVTLPQSAGGYFHPHKPMLWIEGFDLMQEMPTWVPYEVVHTDFSASAPPPSGCFRVSTNGLASGNHLLEAVSHGLCEVVERDGTTLWNYLDTKGKQETEIALDSVDDDLCVDLMARCRRAGLSVRIWDATSDIGIPTCVAELRETSLDRGAAWEKAAFGSGCHPTRGVALARALTEAAQARTTFIAGVRDDMSWDDYESGDDPAIAVRSGHVREPDYRKFSNIASWAADTIRDDLVWATDRLKSVGLDRVIVVDLTRTELALPVVRVIVPGLEGPDEHYEDYVPGPRARALADGLDGPPVP
jgi:ribosomal protein S12 methylthiotransferase accessory factor